MFKSLKKRLKSWLGIEEKKVKKKKKLDKENKKPIKNKKNLENLKKENTIEPIQEKINEKENKSFFSKFSDKFTTSKIKKEQLEPILYELEMILLENNVALEVVDKIKEKVSEKLIGQELKKSELEKITSNSLKEAINSILQEPKDIIKQIMNKKEPFVILFFGINGSGKTTSVAKIANYLQKKDISCILVAADTFRAASIEQLETHSNKLKVHMIKHQYGADPAAVAFDGIAYAKKNNIKAVLIDTAGRMYTKDNLMKEMEKIVRVSKPDLKLFVGESIAGNDVIEQARTFNETAGIDGIILTKTDVDDKGGAALSVSQITNKPIYFIGTGQKYDDLKPFNKEDVIKNLGLD